MSVNDKIRFLMIFSRRYCAASHTDYSQHAILTLGSVALLAVVSNEASHTERYNMVWVKFDASVNPHSRQKCDKPIVVMKVRGTHTVGAPSQRPSVQACFFPSPPCVMLSPVAAATFTAASAKFCEWQLLRVRSLVGSSCEAFRRASP